MKRKIILMLFSCNLFIVASAQLTKTDSLRNAKRDSSLRALIHADSMKIQTEYAEKEKWDKIESRSIFPLIKGSKMSGVIPIKNPTEVPDPNMDYKLLFELTSNNPDSIAKDINLGLDEIIRVINLHIAAGIPVKRIIPVIVVHAEALNAIRNNVAYQKKFKMDNPNIRVINELNNVGAKIIACGQAMEFFETAKDDLLPGIKISITAQTVLSSYQLKGFIKYQM